MESTFEDSEPSLDKVTIPREEDKVEIVDAGYEFMNSVTKGKYTILD